MGKHLCLLVQEVLSLLLLGLEALSLLLNNLDALNLALALLIQLLEPVSQGTGSLSSLTSVLVAEFWCGTAAQR